MIIDLYFNLQNFRANKTKTNEFLLHPPAGVRKSKYYL